MCQFTCPHCGTTDDFTTHSVEITNSEIHLSDYGWDMVSPMMDMDITSPYQTITCNKCGYTGPARYFGWPGDGPETKRTADTKFISVHGRVSLIYCAAIKLHIDHVFPELARPFMSAGYTPGQLVLVSLDPHVMRAFYNAYDADQFDCDLGDAYRWLENPAHWNKVPSLGYLLDLESTVRGNSTKPTTTFEREYPDFHITLPDMEDDA